MCRNNGKVNIALFAAAVLLCLTLFSTHLTSGLYARYTTEASSSDSARVAKWDVQMESTETVMNFNGSTYQQDSEILEYGFSVSNHSEVSMSYTVKAVFGVALPEHTKIRMDHDGQWKACDGNLTEFSFGPYLYAADTQKNHHTLQIQIEYASDTTPHLFESLTNIPVTVSVAAEQID